MGGWRCKGSGRLACIKPLCTQGTYLVVGVRGHLLLPRTGGSGIGAEAPGQADLTWDGCDTRGRVAVLYRVKILWAWSLLRRETHRPDTIPSSVFTVHHLQFAMSTSCGLIARSAICDPRRTSGRTLLMSARRDSACVKPCYLRCS